MKVLKIVLALVICGVIIFSVSCASSSGSTSVAANQTTTVKRGNINVDVTATGNLAFSQTQNINFEVAGTVKEVLVQAGDIVKEGQVLAQLDTASLQTAVETAQRAVQTKELAVKKAERAVVTAERAVITAQRAVTTAQRALDTAVDTAEANDQDVERAVKSAEISLEAATNAYYKLLIPNPVTAYRFTIPESVDSIRVAEARMKEAQDEFQKGLEGKQYSLVDGMDKITEAQKLLADVETQLGWWYGAGVSDTIDYWTLRSAHNQIDTAQIALDTAKSNLEKTKKSGETSVANAQDNVDTAKIALDNAKNNVDTAKSDLDVVKNDLANAKDDLQTAKDNLTKTTIKAPFTGLITQVNVATGDMVVASTPTGTTTSTAKVQIAEPTKFEASGLVSEMDISSVKIGGDATVQVDAMSLNLPAKVTNIAPTATIQSGVVNYSVTVEVQSLQSTQTSQSGQSQSGQGEQTPAVATTQTVTVKQGLSITVTIPILQKNDVLLVPNRAISRQGKDTVVQVIKNGVTESRVITAGVSDLQNTEVTSGLTEGEQVVLPTSTSSSTTSSSSNQGGMMLPIGGGPGGGPP